MLKSCAAALCVAANPNKPIAVAATITSAEIVNDVFLFICDRISFRDVETILKWIAHLGSLTTIIPFISTTAFHISLLQLLVHENIKQKGFNWHSSIYQKERE